MRFHPMFFLLPCLVASVCARAQSPESAAPSPYPMERYVSITAKSPFVPETVSVSSGAAFGADLVLTGHFRMEGVTYVNAVNKKTQERLSFSSAEKSHDRPKVVSLVNNADPYKVTAILQLGAETATIAFEHSAPPKTTGKSPELQEASSMPQNNTAADADKPAQKPNLRDVLHNLKKSSSHQ